jgi:conjugal transfer mating pair stabilization protein TraG
MSTSTEAHGTTIQGIGPEAGIFRYQATMSRLASTFTISERLAQSVAESARTAETQAKTAREAFQRSQSTALTQAMSLQESYERSEQRSHASSVGEGGSRSTQVQTLNNVAKSVNTQLGLKEDSTVGKSVVASASVGVSIPMTEIGARAQAEGRTVDQQVLASAYDYARSALQSAQVADATTLSNEFRTSDAYQWARNSRAAASSALDSAYREASERQSTSERSTSQAQELARTAQFMREWSSGVQTDFTNFAASRLAERGLLREEDPTRLQRAVMDIALGYARGGAVDQRYVAPDSPLGPTRLGASALYDGSQVGQTLEARSSDTGLAPSSDLQLATQRQQNDAAVAQARETAGLGEAQTRRPIDRSPITRARAIKSAIRSEVDQESTAVKQQQASQSDTYNRKVEVNNIRKDHGGNPAAWDTAGADSSNRPDLGQAAPEQAKPRPKN